MMYKVKKGNEVYDKLMALSGKIKECDAAVRAFVKKLGYKEFAYSGYQSYLAGDLGAIYIPTGKPEGWRKEGKNWENFYMPKANQKELWKQINELPKVKKEELTDIIPYQTQTYGKDGKLYWSSIPSVFWTDANVVLIEIPTEIKYKPLKEMIEIKASEFKKLKDFKPKKKQAA